MSKQNRTTIFDSRRAGVQLVDMERRLILGDTLSGGKGRVSRGGGSIADLDGAAAFVLSTPEPSEIPVLIAVPHAGRVYSPKLVARLRHPAEAALRLEDRLVDQLGEAAALATGAGLLVARAPRAMIDLNRAADDVDWEMVARSSLDGTVNRREYALPSQRTRGGLGLIPRRLPGMGELWTGLLDPAELEGRIAGVHVPYHAALSDALQRLHDRWGAVLLIDLHSMPPLAPQSGGTSPTFVIGDRFGTTCSGALIAKAFQSLTKAGLIAAHNRPYAGGYVLERHAAPRRNIHAFQLEIDRSFYLDSRLVEQGAGFAAMVALLAGLVRELASEVADLGRAEADTGLSEAAE